MWATQRLDTHLSASETEIAHSAGEILKLANDTIARGQLQHGFIVFPLFLAGYASSSASDKMLAEDLIRAMEPESIGNNTRATRKLLEIVHERQKNRLMAVGHGLDVDWIQVMLENGMQVVNFGL